jgi:glycosyltransferase involved in cell wall biosynthesis
VKHVLIINQFACTATFSTGAGERFYYLAPYFKKEGINTTIIAGGYNHLLQKIPPTPSLFNEEKIEGATFVWVRMKKYANEKFFGRIYSWFEFLIKLFRYKNKTKPDVVVVSSMSLLSTLYGCYIKWRYKSRFIVEVRDIWPLTPILLGGFSKFHPFIVFLKLVEIIAYRNADHLVSVVPQFDLYLEEHFSFKRPITWVPNAISNTIEPSPTQIRFDPDCFNLVYTGAIGTANALQNVIDVAHLLKDYPKIQFHLIGQGPDKAELEKQAAEHDLPITFYNKVAKTEIPSILAQGDVSFICWTDKPIYRYGVSANKYNDYMLVKNPIISVSNIDTDPVKMAACGLQIKPGDPQSFKEGILSLYNMNNTERIALGKKGYEYLINHKTFDAISKKYIEILPS